MTRKTLLWTVAAALGALGLAVGVLAIPSVQTALVRAALSGQSAGAIEVGRVLIRPSRVTVQGLKIRRQGFSLDVPFADAELGVLPAALGRGYLIRSLSASEWTLDLTGGAGGAAHAQPAAAAGTARASLARGVGAVIAAFTGPIDFSADHVSLRGTVVLPDGQGRAAARARVVAQGGGIAPASTGHFTVDVDAALARDSADPVARVKAHAILTATVDPEGTFAGAAIDMDATATGPRLKEPIALAGRGSAVRQSGRTTYSVALVRNAVTVAALDAASGGGPGRVFGSWKLDVSDEDIAPFALGWRLPDFRVKGSGLYDADTLQGQLRLSGKLDGSLDKLAEVWDRLSGVGQVQLSADFDVTRRAESLRVDRLDLALAAAAPALAIRAGQPFEFNASTGELMVARPAGDLALITLSGMPLGWLRGFAASAGLSGSPATGQLALRAENGRLALRTNAPVTSTGFGLSLSGRPVLADVTANAFVLADYSPQGWQVQVAPLSLWGDGVKLASLDARIGSLADGSGALKAVGTWSASLPLALRQPFGTSLPRLRSGEATGSVEAVLGDSRQLSLRLAATSLVLDSDPGRRLPAVQADIRADQVGQDAWSVRAPVRLDFGDRTANIVVEGTVAQPDASAPVKVSADRVELEDLPLVAGLAATPGILVRGAGGTSGSPAPWSRFPGRFSFTLGGLGVRGVALDHVSAEVEVSRGSVKVEGFSAGLGDGSGASGQGEVAYEEGRARPYRASVDFSVKGLASAPFFKAMNPDREAPVEGRFGIEGRAEAAAVRIADLLANLQGDFRVTSRDGRFRLLRNDSLDLSKLGPSKIAGALDSVGALFGKKNDHWLESLGDSLRGLGDIRYDQFDVRIVRGADLGVSIMNLSMISPEEHVTGDGRIQPVEGLPIDAQPFSMDLQVGVRGGVARVFGLVGLLGDDKDAMGYATLYAPVHLGGTLRDVDRTQLTDLVLRAPLRKGGGIIDKLLGR
jgi:hypothetical protein